MIIAKENEIIKQGAEKLRNLTDDFMKFEIKRVFEKFSKGDGLAGEEQEIFVSFIKDRALQEQAKEIKKELEETLDYCWDDANDIIVDKSKWNAYWEKYCPKEEGK